MQSNAELLASPRKGLAVDVAYCSTNLEELLVLVNCLLVLAEVVVENAG